MGAVLVASVVALGGLGAAGALGDRSAYWRVALRTFVDAPFLGRGPGTFERAWQALVGVKAALEKEKEDLHDRKD